jgi:DNA polymerase III epsilon subunit-like protein
MRYCFLDLETTGLDSARDSIIEISFVLHDEAGKEIERFDEVFHPEKSPLTAFVTHLTGITDEEIQQRGKKLASFLTVLSEKIGNAVIVGHNIDFDINFLVANGVEVSQNQRIDTHELARIVLPGEASFSLEMLSKKYGFLHEDAHRAMSDVEASIQLFDFLKDKIQALPREFLNTVRPVLESRTSWVAKELFLASRGTGDWHPQISVPGPDEELVDSFSEACEKVSAEKVSFVRAGEAHQTARFQKSLARNICKKPEKCVLIVTPRLDFFRDEKFFPIPEVLLDSVRLERFSTKKEKLTDQETAFFLQAKFRQFLGCRGKEFFDLFAGQRKMWTEVCAEEDGGVFAKISQEKMSEKILVISPRAFLRFRNLPGFQNRTLIVDEAELFAENLLFFPSKMWSLAPFLSHKNEEISVATQFFVTNFCRDVIQKKIQREISNTFPERVRFHSSETFEDFAKTLHKFSDDTLSGLFENFSAPRERLVRWATYSPQTGNLSFGAWHPDDWRAVKSDLEKFQIVFFHRHLLGQSNLFFRVFTGVHQGPHFLFPELFPTGNVRQKLEVPRNLPSVKSPDFNAFCTEKILELSSTVTADSALAVNFSSLETLKKVYLDFVDQLSQSDAENEILAVGEKVSGGDGKALQIAQEQKKLVFFFQKMVTADLGKFPFKKLVIQKFPFDAPHPLFEAVEDALRDSGLSFFDLWQIPKVSANISQKVSLFPELEKIIFLDSRENSRWGKEILDSAFPEIS